ncbi:MAG: hypothetical protein QXJ64_03490, partial [Thermosphaera sp.]
MSLKLACYEEPLVYPFWRVIKAIREEIFGCRVVYANPIPCVVSPTTIIDIVDRCDLKIEELKENI